MSMKLKDQRILEIKNEIEKEKKIIKEENQKTIQQFKKNHKNQIKEIMDKHLTQLDSYYQRIINLQQKKKTNDTQYKALMQNLQQKFHKRQSKDQDLDQILKLKTQLVLKERQILKLQEDIKRSQLQRKNNQKNYNRIFSSHSSRRKSSNNSARNKQAFFKQSNPTDLKFILKICNKQF